MKTIFFIIFLSTFLICCTQPAGNNELSQNSLPTSQKQVQYEFKYDKLIASFEDNSRTISTPGKIIFLKDEIQVFKGMQGEKFFINKISNEEEKLIFFCENNKKEKAKFLIYEKANKNYINVDLDGVTMNFNIISGNIDDLALYDEFEITEEANTQTVGEKRQKLTNDCNCEKIYRDDGTIVTQCNSVPIASDNSTQIGLATASNSQEKFVTITIRFDSDAKSITGDLSIRLIDNNMIRLKLVNGNLAYIGNSQVANGVFLLNNDNIQKLLQSKLFTISIILSDNLMHTYECSLNKDVLITQLRCI